MKPCRHAPICEQRTTLIGGDEPPTVMRHVATACRIAALPSPARCARYPLPGRPRPSEAWGRGIARELLFTLPLQVRVAAAAAGSGHRTITSQQALAKLSTYPARSPFRVTRSPHTRCRGSRNIEEIRHSRPHVRHRMGHLARHIERFASSIGPLRAPDNHRERPGEDRKPLILHWVTVNRRKSCLIGICRPDRQQRARRVPTGLPKD